MCTASRLQHGWLEEWDVVGVCGQVKMVQDLFHSVQQLSGLWYLDPAVLPYVLLCGISRMDATELISILEPLQVCLINH